MNKAFFDYIRMSPAIGAGKLTTTQVQVAEEIVEAGQRLSLPLKAVAYILATAWHEAKLTPIRENLNYTTAARLMAVWPSRFKTATSATPYLKNAKKLANFVYGDRLGNRPGTDDGYIFRGGGLDQLTGRGNYAKVGIDHKPETILQPAVAVSSLVHGMVTGRYRGHELANYVGATSADYVNARDIINADKNRKEGSVTVGQLVAQYARAFEVALNAAGYTPAVTARPVAKPATGGTATSGGTIVGVILFMVIVAVAVKLLTGI